MRRIAMMAMGLVLTGLLAGCDPGVTVRGQVMTLDARAPTFKGICVSRGDLWRPPVTAVLSANVFIWSREHSVEHYVGQVATGDDGSFAVSRLGFLPKEIRLRVEAPGYRKFEAIIKPVRAGYFEPCVVLAPEPPQ